MTRTQQKGKSNQTWGALFEEFDATLTAVAGMLLASRISPEQILEEALSALEGSPLHPDFGKISAIRAVVKASVSYHRRTADSVINAEASDDAPKYWFPGILAIGMLPWPERAVYFFARGAALFTPRHRPASRYERRQYRSALFFRRTTNPLCRRGTRPLVNGSFGVISRS